MDWDKPNRTMSRRDLIDDVCMQDCGQMLIKCGEEVLRRGGAFSSWVGTLSKDHVSTTISNKGPHYEPVPWWPWDEDIPWFTLWEYCWVLKQVLEAELPPEARVLSLGGNASLLELTLADLGYDVVVVDRRQQALRAAELNAVLMNVHITGIGRSMEDALPDLAVKERGGFDVMVSTNVLFLAGQAAQQAVSRHLQALIRCGGLALMTFDYQNPNPGRFVSNPLYHFQWLGFAPEPPLFIDNEERYHMFYPDPSKGRYTAGGLRQVRI